MAKTKTAPASAPLTPTMSPVSPVSPVETPETTSPSALLDDAQDVPTSEETAVVVRDRPGAVATLQEFGDLMESEALESPKDLGFAPEDVAVPFLRVLQSNSPQVKRQNAKYIMGAEAGSFFNTALLTVYDGQKGIDLVPVVFKRQATLWVPRTDTGGGGFAGEIPMQDADDLLKTGTKKNDKGKDITTRPYQDKPAGLELSISAMYYCLQIDRETNRVTQVAFPLTSTQMKKARAWNATIMNSRLPNRSGPGSYMPPMYGFAYRVTTLPEANAKGDWMGVKITQGEPLLSFKAGNVVEGWPGAVAIYQAASEFAKLIGEGKVRTRDEDMDVEIVHEPAASGPEEDDKLPF